MIEWSYRMTPIIRDDWPSKLSLQMTIIMIYWSYEMTPIILYDWPNKLSIFLWSLWRTPLICMIDLRVINIPHFSWFDSIYLLSFISNFIKWFVMLPKWQTRKWGLGSYGISVFVHMRRKLCTFTIRSVVSLIQNCCSKISIPSYLKC